MPHHHCCILGCRSDSRYTRDDNLSMPLKFFCVPSLSSKSALHHQWLQMIRRPDLLVSRNTRVCSLHFADGRPTKENPLPTLKLEYDPLEYRPNQRSHIKKCLSKGVKLNVDLIYESSRDSHDAIGALQFCKRRPRRKNKDAKNRTSFDNQSGCNSSHSDSLKTNPPFSYSFSEDESNMGILPETILREDKQTQTDSSAKQDDSKGAFPMDTVNNRWEGENQHNFHSQIHLKMPVFRQQNCQRTTTTTPIYVNFGIDFIKLDNNQIRYYTGLPCYSAFRTFLDELRPKLGDELERLQCLDQNVSGTPLILSMENELLVALVVKRLNHSLQDVAYRSGTSLDSVEKIIALWGPILECHPSKPWLCLY